MRPIDDQRAEAGQLVTWACIIALHQRHAINQNRFVVLADSMIAVQDWHAREGAKGVAYARRSLEQRAAEYCEPRFGFPGNYKRTRAGQMLREELTSAASMAWQLMVIAIVDAFGWKRKAIAVLKEEVRTNLEQMCTDMYSKTDMVKDGSGWRRVENREYALQKMAVLVSEALGEDCRVIDEDAWRKTAGRLQAVTRDEIDRIKAHAVKCALENKANRPAGQPFAVLSTEAKLKAASKSHIDAVHR